MKSLFLKIFLSFWLAQALFVVLAILVTSAIRPPRQISAVEALQSKFLSEAVDAYHAGGTDKLRDYLHNLRETQHVHVVLFRDQENLMGRPVPPWFSEVARGQRHTVLRRPLSALEIGRAELDPVAHRPGRHN